MSRDRSSTVYSFAFDSSAFPFGFRFGSGREADVGVGVGVGVSMAVWFRMVVEVEVLRRQSDRTKNREEAMFD